MTSSTSIQQRPLPSTPSPARKNDTTLSTPKASNATPQKVPPFNSNNNNNNGTHPKKVTTPATASSSIPTPASTKATPTTTTYSVQRITSSKHEEFKNQLVHDVFERDNKGRVPMEKVAMLIWQFRTDPAVVQFMAQFVAKVSS
jgi:hypothetical protein